jgi:hypothetical protein
VASQFIGAVLAQSNVELADTDVQCLLKVSIVSLLQRAVETLDLDFPKICKAGKAQEARVN